MASRRKKAKHTATKPRLRSSALKLALRGRDEALRFQAATAEILASLSRSSADARPVFEAIVANVLKLFRTRYAAVFVVKGEELHLAASQGDARLEMRRAPAFEKFRSSFPQRIDWEGFTGRALRSGKVSQIAPIIGNPKATAQAVQLAKDFGYDAMLVAPLMKDGRAIGCIGTTRPQGEPFDARQLALFEAFAAQAVIAIENARLFNETKEALERQTAISEVLTVISGSPADLAPILEAVASRAARLCDASDARIFLVQGDEIRHAAGFGDLPVKTDVFPAGRGTSVGTAIADGRVVHVRDIEQEGDKYPVSREIARKAGWRTTLNVPLMRERRALGAISLRRAEVRPFTDRQSALLKVFADQAAIAIENARLFNETKEALEQQTATSTVLSVISGSPTNTEPVFEAIAERAAVLCAAETAFVTTYDGHLVHMRAFHGTRPEATELIRAGYPMQPTSGSAAGRAIRDAVPVQIPDVLADPEYAHKEAARDGGWRSTLSVPMVRDDRVVGAISVARTETGVFPDKQLALLKTFADQAVIAIENARLFNETEEALERQTATAEILKVISSSPTDVQPVFETIARFASRLCGGAYAIVTRFDGDLMHLVAEHNARPGTSAPTALGYPRRPGRDAPSPRAIHEHAVVHIPYAEQDADLALGFARAVNAGSFLAVPMLREDVPIGTIGVSRSESGPFPDKQIELVQVFADQAVIAIENVRLFNETKEALEQQKASADVLGAISGSIADAKPVFEKILASCERLFEGDLVGITLADGDTVHLAAYHGPRGEQLEKVYPLPLTRESGTGWAILNAQVAHFPDIEAERVPPGVVAGCRTLKVRAIVFAPMLFEGKGIGAIWVARAQAGAFTDKQIAQLRTFADQAVIAIQNARLVNETTEALDQQRATAQVLQTISRSAFELQTVLDTLVQNAARLIGVPSGQILRRQGSDLRIAAVYAVDPRERAFWEQWTIAVGSPVLAGIVAATKKPLAGTYRPDDSAARETTPEARAYLQQFGMTSALAVPLLKDEEVIGVLHVGGHEERRFTKREFELLQTFADQAVIAIENVRLFREIQEKSAQLEVANKHKSDFLANMSHELRTPLNAIIGFSEVLIDKMFGEVNEKQVEYLKDIHESGRHLLSLINDILDLSKIEAGRMELELSSFHLPNAISNAMTLVRERAQRHGIRLGVEMDPGLGEFEADERKVKQILLNLLSNAVKFTPDGGKVDVLARKMDGKVEIAVRDTGVGIAPEDQALVFEEFKQVGRDYTRKAEGTGLGLALTKRLVELHGGEIALESAPGKGSTFTVKLPLR